MLHAPGCFEMPHVTGVSADFSVCPQENIHESEWFFECTSKSLKPIPLNLKSNQDFAGLQGTHILKSTLKQ
jgi:hypothetical protein